MCGIIGVAGKVSEEDRHWLRIGRDTMTHRGPDDAGVWWSMDGCVGLAHRRLSIIDLSPQGHQPMHHHECELTIVFNGEIYNFLEIRKELERLGHRFKSRSDTEVLLASYAQWGMDCLKRLNGMFAFAIYDRVRQRLFLARDRAGEKPLFYYLAEGTLYFASELKALMANPALPRRIDPVALDCYLAMGYVPGERCILAGYNKLPPAHAMIFDLSKGTAKVWRYWQLPEMDEKACPVDETDLLDELELLLEDAVRRQMVADVPVGILLSGGVDSSLVTAMAVRHSSKVRTFTIGFPGHGRFDETPHARLIAKYFDTEHMELMADPTTADLVPTLARQFDEPVVDSSMIPTFIVSRLVRQYCTVALGGDGGDELFGGYGHYSRLLWINSRLGWIPCSLRHLAARVALRFLPIGFKGRSWLQGLKVDVRDGLPLIANFFDAIARRKLMAGLAGYQCVAEKIFSERIPRQEDLLQRVTRMDFYHYLAEDILVKVDRTSMLNSLEVRAPLLDYRIIEFAFAKVPSHLKATSHEKKILLKRLAARLFPPEFDLKRKQGFSIPMAPWLKAGSFRELFWDTLTSADCIFDSGMVMSLLSGQDKGRSNGERLFALVLFELWRKAYRITI